jgi:hypothetical protein
MNLLRLRLVAALDQLGDEPAADRTTRPYHEDSYRFSHFRHIGCVSFVSPSTERDEGM